ESAITEGTKKLYLIDYQMLSCDATVSETEELDEESARIILSQTCFYPGGGGQPCDLGRIEWPEGALELTEVTKDANGIVSHVGKLEGVLPDVGSMVQCQVEAARRSLNSRLHSAGHLIDLAVNRS